MIVFIGISQVTALLVDISVIKFVCSQYMKYDISVFTISSQRVHRSDIQFPVIY